MKMVSILLITALFSSLAHAECKWASDIKENQDGTYTYSRDCHIEVGKKVKGYFLLESEVQDLRKAIELKDLALTKQTQHTQLWMDTSLKTGEELQKYERVRAAENNLYFISGVGLAILSVWAAGQIAK